MTNTSEGKFTVSSRRLRISAFVIDHGVLTFLMVSIAFLILGPNFIDDNNGNRLTIALLAVMIPGFFLYFAKDSVKGVSLGKWIMGIMVRDLNSPNEIPSFWRLFTRNLFVIIWPVEFIVLTADSEKRRLGDKVAKTLVVLNPAKAKRTPRILALAMVGVAFFAFTFLFAGAAIKNSDAYKVAIREIEQNAEIVNETGGIKEYGMMPTGGVNISNGYGQAQFQITVIGVRKELTVSVYLTKEPQSEWKLVELRK